MSAGFSGASGTIRFSNTSLLGCQRWEINPVADTRETTCFESNGHREHKPTLKGWDGSFQTQNYPGDLTGSVAVGSFSTGTGIPGASGTAIVHSGTIVITGVPVATPFDDLISWRVAFRGSGPRTEA